MPSLVAAKAAASNSTEPPQVEGQPVRNGITVFEPLSDVHTIMITGGGGFIGSWLAHALATTYADHYRIVLFDKFDYQGSLNNCHFEDGINNIAIFKGDIGLDSDVSTCIRAYSVDAVIHLSAQTSVDTSLADPYGSSKANVIGTHVVLENAYKNGVKRFIHMSSAEVYGAATPGPNGFHETALLSPVNPYGASKAASELLVKLYGNKGGMITNIVRSSNVYGPKQFPDKLIPKSVALLMNGHKVTMYGTGADVKRWLYVSDCSNAFNTILHRGEPNATYNLGSDHASTNYNLCTGIIDAVVSNKGDGTKAGNAEDWINRVPGRGFYDPGIGMDFSALQQLGWTQLVSLDEGVKRTVEWYKENAATWWGDLQKILKI